jgi:hypothetical protein
MNSSGVIYIDDFRSRRFRRDKKIPEKDPIGGRWAPPCSPGVRPREPPLFLLIPFLVDVTTQDFIKFWGKFFAYVLLEMIEISQGFKTFEPI